MLETSCSLIGQKKEHSYMVYLVLFLSLLVFLYSVKAKADYMQAYGLHPDINVISTPAKNLLKFGNLKYSGHDLAFRVIRDGYDDLDNLEQPFWMDYIGPVFYYLPFIAIWGSKTGMSILLAQIFSLLALVHFIFYFFRDKPIVLTSSLVLLVTSSTLDFSLWLSPTVILYLLFYVVFYAKLDYFIEHPLYLGLLLGLAYQFRPEVLFILPSLAIYLIFTREKNLFDFLKFFLKAVFTMASTLVLFLLIRSGLGAGASVDHKLFVLGTDVLEPHFGVAFGNTPYTISDLFTPEALDAFLNKFMFRVKWFFSFKHFCWKRPDLIFYYILIGLAALNYKKIDKKIIAEIILIVSIISFGVCLGWIGCDNRKYYDIPLFIIAMFFVKNSQLLIFENGIKSIVFYALSFFVAFSSIQYSNKTYSISENIFKEESNIAVAKFLKTYLPSDARLISHNPLFWTWYADGKHNVFYDNSTYLDPKLIENYQPDALLLSTPIKAGSSNEFKFGDLKPRYSLKTRDGNTHYLFLK